MMKAERETMNKRESPVRASKAFIIALCLSSTLAGCASHASHAPSTLDSSSSSQTQSASTPASPSYTSASDSKTAQAEESTAGTSAPSAKLDQKSLDQQSEEASFAYDGARWNRSWFQCEQNGEVALLLMPPASRTQRYLSFPMNAPAQQTKLELQQQGEEDCAMMKCRWTFAATGEQARTFVFQESHYFDMEDGYWTRQYRAGSGPDEETAGRELRDCRWLPRTRVAILTDRRSVYVTETKTGGLEYSSYNYDGGGARASLKLKGGVRRLDEQQGVESFTFRNGAYTYIVNVGSERHPTAQVLVRQKDKLVQEEHCLSYTYFMRRRT